MTATALRDEPLASLTDVEVGALDPQLAADERLVPLERFDALDAEAREQAAARGLLSLLRRGLLAEGDDVLVCTGPLREIRTRQITASTIAIVDVLGPVPESRYLYVNRDDAVLEQAVRRGRHVFAVRSVASAVGELVALADPHGRARADGPQLVDVGERPPEWGELDAAVASAESVVRLQVVRRPDEETLLEYAVSVVAGPAGVWALAGNVEGEEVAAVARELGADSLRLLFGELLGVE